MTCQFGEPGYCSRDATWHRVAMFDSATARRMTSKNEPTTNGVLSWRMFCTICSHLRRQYDDNHKQIVWVVWLPICEPSTASQEEVTCVEVMCHGLAAL